MIEGMAHMTTDPPIVPVVAGPTMIETFTQVASRAAIASRLDQDMVGIPIEIGPEMATGMVVDGMTTTEGGRDTTMEVGTTIPANEGTSRRLRSHGLLGGYSRLYHPSSFFLLSFVGKSGLCSASHQINSESGKGTVMNGSFYALDHLGTRLPFRLPSMNKPLGKTDKLHTAFQQVSNGIERYRTISNSNGFHDRAISLTPASKACLNLPRPSILIADPDSYKSSLTHFHFFLACPW